MVDADEILVLDHGEIVERGRHDELVARKGGHYASMWNKQKQAAAAREKLKEVENDPDGGARHRPRHAGCRQTDYSAGCAIAARGDAPTAAASA